MDVVFIEYRWFDTNNDIIHVLFSSGSIKDNQYLQREREIMKFLIARKDKIYF